MHRDNRADLNGFSGAHLKKKKEGDIFRINIF